MIGRRAATVLATVLACCALVLWPAAAAAAGVPTVPGWFVPPLPPPLKVLRSFAPPGEPWLAGNRGVDFAAVAGEPVFAAASGIVLYAGLIAGRGVVSVNHGALRTTYEPVDPLVSAGATVARGQLIGRVSGAADACGPPGGCLHWGAIEGDTYVDPMGLLVARPVRLLPIWSSGVPIWSSGVPLPEAAQPLPEATQSPARVPGQPDVSNEQALPSAVASDGQQAGRRRVPTAVAIGTLGATGALFAVAATRRALRGAADFRRRSSGGP
jgi:hypothetical protein